jgi:hypothetical protein
LLRFHSHVFCELIRNRLCAMIATDEQRANQPAW